MRVRMSLCPQPSEFTVYQYFNDRRQLVRFRWLTVQS